MSLRLSIAQINPIVGDLAGNAKKVLQAWQKEKDSDLVIFPELILTGYPPEDLILKSSFMDAVEHQLEELKQASSTFHAAALITPPWRIEGKVYNTAHIIHGGKTLTTIAKRHLPNYGVFDEPRIFASGPLPEPVNFKGQKLGIMICEDMWHTDVAAHLKVRGADMLIVPNCSPYEIGKHAHRLYLARKRIQETGLPLIYAHIVGGQDDLVFDGGSFAMDANGAVTFQAPFFENYIGGIDTDLKADDDKSDESSIYRALTLGLKDYVEKNNCPGVILGLSGGVDSALVATLAVDALGAQRVRVVMLPSPFTSQESIDDAQALADNLKVKLESISIQPTAQALTQTIPANAPPVTFENIQSRARGVILMALSNASGALLLTTGNKSEMATGYATLYGDMCGGFNPLKDVYKTIVYRLCNWRNTQENVIPQRILTKDPTAELKPNQRDQDTLPPYAVLDTVLQGLIEDDLDVSAVTAKGHDKTMVERVYAMLNRAEYKRRQSAPGTKITARAFGRDRRYPITNHF